MTMQLWTDCAVATLQPAATSPYGLIEDAALVLEADRVLWVGPRTELPAELRERCQQQHEAGGALITPGLIDCHTHLVYAGDRAREFELRLNGATYEEIARSGGGIASTVRATRAASAEALQAQSRVRLKALLAQGVTTVVIKSGYGLAMESERRRLEQRRLEDGLERQSQQLRGSGGVARHAVEGAEPAEVVLQVVRGHAVEAAHPGLEARVVGVDVLDVPSAHCVLA